MKFGIFTVSMPDYEPVDCLAKAGELGYDGVEWRVTVDKGDKAHPSFWFGNRTSMSAEEVIAQADVLKAKAAEVGVTMPSLATYIDCFGLNSWSTEAVDAEKGLDVVRQHMEAAVAVGAKSLRIGSGKYEPSVPYLEQVAKANAQYAKVAEMAAEYGVRALIETHMGLLTPTVTKTLAVLKGLDPKYVGIMWDPGNQVLEGAEVAEMALSEAGAYLGEVHAKNMQFEPITTQRGQIIWRSKWCGLEAGIVNWPAVMDVLKAIGYDGWVMFEDFSTALPLDERLASNLAWFKSLAE